MIRLTTLFLAILVTSMPVLADVTILDKIVAVVDDDVIMQSEVDTRRQAVIGQLKGKENQLPPDDILNKQIVERLIIESLQLQMANRAGVKVSDEELNSALTRIAAQNKMTLPEFSQEIEKDGISYKDMREQIRKEIKISRVQQGVMRNRIQITDQEVEAFLQSDAGKMITADEYRLAHILLPFPPDATGDQILAVKLKAEALMKEIRDGADFQTLAIERSTASDALEGGDLGWRKTVQLPTMFSEIAPKLKVGEIGGPIKSGSGYHVIKLLDKRGAQAEGQVEQTRVRHVLIKPSEILTDEEARDFAESLRAEVAAGRPFDEVAKLYSDDPGSALSGGDLDWNPAGTFVPEFEDMMNKSKINELSPVFHTQHGYHFLEVTGRRVEDLSQELLKRQAANFLRNQRMDEEIESWVREMRDEAFVEIRD